MNENTDDNSQDARKYLLNQTETAAKTPLMDPKIQIVVKPSLINYEDIMCGLPKEDFITNLRSKHGKKVDSCILLLFSLAGIIHSKTHPVVNDPNWSWMTCIGEKTFGAIFVGVLMDFIDKGIKACAKTKK